MVFRVSEADESEKELKRLMGLSNYGMKAATSHTSIEKEKLWAGRLNLVGTRQVFICRLDDLRKHMAAKNIYGIDPKTHFRDVRVEGLTSMIDAGITLWFPRWGPTIICGFHRIALSVNVWVQRIAWACATSCFCPVTRKEWSE